MALSLLPLAWVPHWGAAGVGYMAMMALVSLTRPAMGIYMMAMTPVAWRTTISGVYTMAIGLSWSIISAGGGYLIAWVGYQPFFLISATLTGLGALLFGWWQEERTQHALSPTLPS